jgi:hypothetical protein
MFAINLILSTKSTLVGSSMEAVRERYVVVSPDDEATASPDEFN